MLSAYTCGSLPNRIDLFVARPLALVNQPLLNPPHQRMKPEDGFDHHVNGCGEIVAAADVTQFVREDRFKLSIGEPLTDASRPHQHRA